MHLCLKKKSFKKTSQHYDVEDRKKKKKKKKKEKRFDNYYRSDVLSKNHLNGNDLLNRK
jgi:hypothetical protein